MTHAVRKESEFSLSLPRQAVKRLREAALIALGGVSLFVLMALWSHHPADPGWSHTGTDSVIHNQGGLVGAYVADIAMYLFGQFAHLFPLMVAFSIWVVFKEGAEDFFADYFHMSVRFVGFVLTLVAGCGLFWVRASGSLAELPHDSGGILGHVVGGAAYGAFGHTGGCLLLLATFLTGFTLFSGLSWLWLMDVLGDHALRAWDWLLLKRDDFLDYRRGQRAKRERVAVVKEEIERQEQRPPPRIEPRIEPPAPSQRIERERQEALFEQRDPTELPELSLLDTPVRRGGGYSPEALEAMSRQVEMKLRDFNIEVEVVAVHPGPVITRFELQPAPGIKASRITGLSKDLARSLSTVSVRVVEVIPGKTCIGLEIPNEQREIVALSDIVLSDDHGTPGDTSDDFTPVFIGGDADGDGLLDIGETWIYEASTVVSAGQYTNLGTVTGTPVDADGNPVPSLPQPTDTDVDNHFGARVAIDIEKFVRGVVARLTRKHESDQPVPWKMGDAPADYLAEQLSHIVGIEVRLTRLEGKRKLNQHHEKRDREGAIQGLESSGQHGLAQAMRDTARPEA